LFYLLKHESHSRQANYCEDLSAHSRLLGKRSNV